MVTSCAGSEQQLGFRTGAPAGNGWEKERSAGGRAGRLHRRNSHAMREEVSVTTVLVPVLEPEAEALFAGGEDARRAALEAIRRALVLRARVARVDAIRDELHDLLFAHWRSG